MAELPQIGPQTPAEPTVAVGNPTNDDQPFTAKPFAPLVGFLELGESELTNKTQTALSEIWEYLSKETNSELISDRLMALRSLESRLSPPKIGQSRFYKVHQYIKAQQEVQRAEKWRNSFYKELDG